MSQFRETAIDRLDFQQLEILLGLGQIIGYVKLLRAGQIYDPKLIHNSVTFATTTSCSLVS
jgi:hypothetical protein